MAIDLSKFIVRFVEEARDHLGRLSEGLSLMEQGQASQETIHALFRSAHTVKGSARMLKLMPISELAHQVEEVLGALREQQIPFSSALLACLFQSIDALANMVDLLEQHKDPAQCQPVNAQLMAQLSLLLKAPALEPTLADNVPNHALATPELSQSLPDKRASEAPVMTLKTADTVRVRLSKLDELLALMGEVVSSHSRLRQRLQEAHQLTHASRMAADGLGAFYRAFKEDVQQQDLQMNELLDKALLMRMLPLSIVFEPASRLVRELGQSIGKTLTCVIQGAEIELDRQLIDRLSDPIVHLIRNAIDHGIELPEKRLALAKPAQGKISLSARQDAGWVVIEVADDGAGILVSDVLEKAIRKGLTTPEQAKLLTEQEIIDFIFLPGFSTSQMITELSGRGVGMDVVKTIIIDDLQGSITVQTQPNVGTRFQLRLPLSLAVMRVLMVRAANQYWGFTAQYVSELIRVEKTALMNIAERQVVIVRNEFVPVAALCDLLALAPSSSGQEVHLLLLVVQLRYEKLALIIDELVDERDMVIKPMPSHLRFNQQVSGMVVTGDNQLVNLLHLPALFALAQASRRQVSGKESALPEQSVSAKRILVVDDSLNTREIEKDVLEAHGYQVTLAEDGVDALNKAQETQFDAILTDVEMPNMDGFTLTAQLRQLTAYQHTPIMIITSREKEADKRRGMQVGADAYIVKGDFDQSNLVTTLKALLA